VPVWVEPFDICYLTGIFKILKIIVIRNISGKNGSGLELNGWYATVTTIRSLAQKKISYS
jgi:hypothetical protein